MRMAPDHHTAGSNPVVPIIQFFFLIILFLWSVNNIMTKPPKKPEFCDGCCYRRNCNHDLEKCCYLVKNNCIIENYSYKEEDIK